MLQERLVETQVCWALDETRERERDRESLSNFQFIKFRHSPGQCCNMLQVFAPGIPKGGSLYSTQVILSMTATESTMGTGCMGYDVTDARYGSKQGNPLSMMCLDCGY